MVFTLLHQRWPPRPMFRSSVVSKNIACRAGLRTNVRFTWPTFSISLCLIGHCLGCNKLCLTSALLQFFHYNLAMLGRYRPTTTYFGIVVSNKSNSCNNITLFYDGSLCRYFWWWTSNRIGVVNASQWIGVNCPPHALGSLAYLKQFLLLLSSIFFIHLVVLESTNALFLNACRFW